MSEYGIYDSILIRENTGQINPVLWYILLKKSKALDSTLGERGPHAKI